MSERHSILVQTDPSAGKSDLHGQPGEGPARRGADVAARSDHWGTTDRGTTDRAPSGCQTIETTEIRWFCDEALPASVISWFTQEGSLGNVEVRSDVYQLDGRSDIGVKRRARTTLELKIRSSSAIRDLPGVGPSGVVEVWQKWSPADDYVSGGSDRTVAVHKRVIKRRFAITGDEIAVTDGTGPPGPAFCDVEIVAVDDGRADAWTFAFAAQGPRRSRHANIATAWRALVSVAPPDGWTSAFAVSCGYPEWLEQRHATSTSTEP